MATTGVRASARDMFQRRVASIQGHLSAEDVEQIAIEICARSGTAVPFGEDAVVRPAELPSTHPMHRDDGPSVSGRLDAAAEEQAYRRGYHQGTRAVIELVRGGACLAELESICQRLERWRRRPIQRIGAPPGAADEFADGGDQPHR
jgi:hypothetical protein